MRYHGFFPETANHCLIISYTIVESTVATYAYAQGGKEKTQTRFMKTYPFCLRVCVRSLFVGSNSFYFDIPRCPFPFFSLSVLLPLERKGGKRRRTLLSPFPLPLLVISDRGRGKKEEEEEEGQFPSDLHTTPFLLSLGRQRRKGNRFAKVIVSNKSTKSIYFFPEKK